MGRHRPLGNISLAHRRQTPLLSAEHLSVETHLALYLTIVSTHCSQTPSLYSTHTGQFTPSRRDGQNHCGTSCRRPSLFPHTFSRRRAHNAKKKAPAVALKAPVVQVVDALISKDVAALDTDKLVMKNESTQKTVQLVLWTSAVLDFEHVRVSLSVDFVWTPSVVLFAHCTHTARHSPHKTPSAKRLVADFRTGLFVAANACSSPTPAVVIELFVIASSHSNAPVDAPP